jgi:hypothetical protein
MMDALLKDALEEVKEEMRFPRKDIEADLTYSERMLLRILAELRVIRREVAGFEE